MSDVVTLGTRQMAHTAKQLDLIRRTVAADCDNDEFNLFIEAARRSGLDPFRKQIYAVVYNKKNPEKRRMSLITSIDGYRAIAARCGDYRPDDSAPVIDASETAKCDTNPAGLISATVKCFKRSPSGEWFPVSGTAYWAEFVPLKEIWRDNRPTGEFQLDATSKWRTMPRLMLAKVAEAQALRKGWPEDLSGIYAEDEMTRASSDDASASELVEKHQIEQRIRMIGGDNSITILWTPDAPLENVPIGRFFDRATEFIGKIDNLPDLCGWEDTNRVALQSFWARAKADALELKKVLEARKAELAVAARMTTGGAG